MERRGVGPIPESIAQFMRGKVPETEAELRIYQYAQRCCAAIDYLILQERTAQEKAHSVQERLAALEAELLMPP